MRRVALLLDGGQDRLGHRELKQPSLLPRGDRHLAEDGGGLDLAGDGHDDHVAAALVVGIRADASLVVGPEAKYLDHALLLQHLIDQATLDVDAP